MNPKLHTIVQEYLQDSPYLEGWKQVVIKRDESIPELKALVLEFVDGNINLQTFRDRMDSKQKKLDIWGATGFGWQMQINKLAKYHGAPAEQGLREALTGLTALNVGERIEQFYLFLEQEHTRLRERGGQGKGTIVSPGNSAFLISLFAFWLDRRGNPYICYDSLKRGLKFLIDLKLLPETLGLNMWGDTIDIKTARDYEALGRALDNLLHIEAPELKQTKEFVGYRTEAFLKWVTEHQKDIARVMQELSSIEHQPLLPVPAHLLASFITEVQRRLLVDAALVRRIYHALLAGDVILTGPPGTGKTDLARILPELLWQSTEAAGSSTDPYGDPIAQAPTTRTAYTTRVVTATDEWSVRTLIGGIVPTSDTDGQVRYRVQPGYLTQTILENWTAAFANPGQWASAQRVTVRAPGIATDGAEQEFRGRWLVIDEFNRAPIDLALGEALTALGSGLRTRWLRVPVDGGSAELPIPRDFRIIGTLNSFDRHYLNQISEALKRRFAFIEVLPPTRQQRTAEQGIVLYKALSEIQHLNLIEVSGDRTTIDWQNVVTITFAPETGFYTIQWADKTVQDLFESGWNFFEIIRIYRQLGTAQAIALFRQMLIVGLVQGREEALLAPALDAAFCETIADQLHVLLPDELEVLLAALAPRPDFAAQYNALLVRLMSSPRRLYAQLDALSRVSGPGQRSLYTPPENLDLLELAQPPQIPAETLAQLFRLDHPRPQLPQFANRLRRFKAEQGL